MNDTTRQDKGRHTDKHHQHDVDGDDVNDKHITSPRGDHVEITQSTASRDEKRASVHRLHPQIESEDQSENGHSLIIVRSSDRTGNVRGNHAHERSGEQRGVGTTSSLEGQQITHHSRSSSENRGDENRHVAHLDGEVQHVQDLMEEIRSSHQTRIGSSPNNTTKRIPGAIIHPVEELIGSGPSQELGSTVVEPGIVFVNHLQ